LSSTGFVSTPPEKKERTQQTESKLERRTVIKARSKTRKSTARTFVRTAAKDAAKNENVVLRPARSFAVAKPRFSNDATIIYIRRERP
jgi:hypothetical protein